MAQLGFATYAEYLTSPHWQNFRTCLLKRENVPEMCWGCRMPVWAVSLVYGQQLNVHHIKYDRLGREEFNDVVVLCRRCHQLEHFPTTELPAISFQVCPYKMCLRPAIAMNPPMSELNVALRHHFELESVGDIIRSQGAAITWGKKRFEKIREIVTHPQCALEFQQRQILANPQMKRVAKPVKPLAEQIEDLRKHGWVQ